MKEFKIIGPEHIPPELAKWFEKESYLYQDSCWSRKPKYFLRNKDVSLEIIGFNDGEGNLTYDMEFSGPSPQYEINVRVSGLTASTLIKNGRGIEHRLCDSWNDLDS